MIIRPFLTFTAQTFIFVRFFDSCAVREPGAAHFHQFHTAICLPGQDGHKKKYIKPLASGLIYHHGNVSSGCHCCYCRTSMFVCCVDARARSCISLLFCPLDFWRRKQASGGEHGCTRLEFLCLFSSWLSPFPKQLRWHLPELFKGWEKKHL